MKCKLPRIGLELGSPCPFPRMITISLWVHRRQRQAPINTNISRVYPTNHRQSPLPSIGICSCTDKERELSLDLPETGWFYPNLRYVFTTVVVTAISSCPRETEGSGQRLEQTVVSELPSRNNSRKPFSWHVTSVPTVLQKATLFVLLERTRTFQCYIVGNLFLTTFDSQFRYFKKRIYQNRTLFDYFLGKSHKHLPSLIWITSTQNSWSSNYSKKLICVSHLIFYLRQGKEHLDGFST